MKRTTLHQMQQNKALHRFTRPQDYRLLSAEVDELGDVTYVVQIKWWPAIKLATKHWFNAVWPVLIGMAVLLTTALLLIIFGG